MPWYGWTVVGVIAVSSFAVIASIGKPREPVIPLVAACVVAFNTLIIWAIIELGTR